MTEAAWQQPRDGRGMTTTTQTPHPRGSGFQPLALLFALVAVLLLGYLLEFALPPRPHASPRVVPNTRVAYVSPQLLGITPLPEPSASEEDPGAGTPASHERSDGGGEAPAVARALPRPEQVAPPTSPETGRRHSEYRDTPDAAAGGASTTVSRAGGVRGVTPPKPAAPAGAVSPDIGSRPAVAEQPRPTSKPIVQITPRPPTPPPALGETREPRVVRRVEPLYPPIARSQGIGGRVTIRITVATDGSVENVKIEHSTSPLFNQAALKAARQMRFEPGLVNGKPVRADYLQTFDFRTR